MKTIWAASRLLYSILNISQYDIFCHIANQHNISNIKHNKSSTTSSPIKKTHWKTHIEKQTPPFPLDNLIQHIQPRWFGTFQGYWARSLHAALDYARRCHRLQSTRSRKSKRWRCSGQASLEVTPQVASTKKNSEVNGQQIHQPFIARK